MKRKTLSSLFVLFLAALYADEPIKVGIIGMDSSHCVAFTKIIHKPDGSENLKKLKVVAAYPGGSPDIEGNAGKIEKYTAQLTEIGVVIVDTIPKLLEQVDVVMIESVDGRPHLEQVIPVFQAGKRVFIDKPLAGTLADAIAIERLGRRFKTPWFSSSSLRFAPDTLALRIDSEKAGKILGAEAWSPSPTEPHHPDLFWYGIHGVETLFTMMGPGVVSLVRSTTEHTDVVTGTWKDGRIGTFRGLKPPGKRGYGGTAFGTKAILPAGGFQGYEPLIERNATFFITGEIPVDHVETLEIMAFMEAADESKRQGGKPVVIKDVMEKAEKAATLRMEQLIPPEENEPVPSLMQVPGPRPKAGEGWYRCWVKVPNNWTDLKGRPLWYESVTLQVNEFAGAHEVFINGQSIGGAESKGVFSRHKVTPGSLKKGIYNNISIRVDGGKEGFTGPPPILAGYFLEVRLAGEWEYRGADARDQGKAWINFAKAEKPAHAAYDQFKPASSVLKRPDQLYGGARLTPEESLKTFTLNDPAFELDLVLSEPLIGQPLQLSFDARGRMWVVEYRQYPYPAGVEVVSRDRYYRSIYKEMPKPPPHHTPGADRISIHEDTNGDGTLDTHKNFIDGMNMVTAVAPAGNGAWVLNPPYMLFYPDRNRDDVPDGDPEVHLSGFGMQDTHSMVNSLRWGPDGWLYACHGSTTSSQVEGHAGKAVYIEGPAVWRYHPTRKVFEIISLGMGNLFSLEFDAKGRMYSGYNGGNTRGFHVRHGAYYAKGGRGKYGPAANPYSFGFLPAMKSEKGISRFSHSFAIYESDGLSAEYHGNFFCVDPLARKVVRSVREADGSTFKTRDLGFPLASADPAFRPVDIKVGPDGAMYIADFYEFYIAHGQHFQGQIDPESGRVYRLRGKNWEPEQPFDLRKKSDRELIKLFGSGSKWHRETALRVLSERGTADVNDLAGILNGDNQPGSLEAVWALHQQGDLTRATRQAMQHANPAIRAWTVQCLTEQGTCPETVIEHAANEGHPEVQAHYAAAAHRLEGPLGLKLLSATMKSAPDVKDPQLPLLMWWAMEKHATEDPKATVDLFKNPESWEAPIGSHLAERLARRLVASGKQRELSACEALLKHTPASARSAVLNGITQALENRPVNDLPVSLIQALGPDHPTAWLVVLRNQEPSALERALKTVRDPKAADRETIIRILGENRIEYDVLLELLSDPKETLPIRKAALAALGAYPGSGPMVLAQAKGLPVSLNPTLHEFFISRKDWARDWFRAVEQKALPRPGLSRMQRETLLSHEDPTLVKWAVEATQTTRFPDAQAEVKSHKHVIAEAPGDPYAGHGLYLGLCGPCHKLFQDGGDLGPDLTSYARTDLDLMLFHVVDPNAEIREGFGACTIRLKDGRALSGFIEDEDAQQLILVGEDGTRHRLARASIVQQRPLPFSLMPEGLLSQLDNQPLRDLIAYLRAGQPMVK